MFKKKKNKRIFGVGCVKIVFDSELVLMLFLLFYLGGGCTAPPLIRGWGAPPPNSPCFLCTYTPKKWGLWGRSPHSLPSTYEGGKVV
jgi:hypothetical protein